MAADRRYAWWWLVVALQIAIPASYYLRSANLDDERFAWRMFSGVRLKHCSVSAREHGEQLRNRSVPLRGALHGSWVHAIERGRERVIERFLSSRCSPSVSQVTLERRCEGVDDSRIYEREVYEYACASQVLRQQEIP
ncbi:MAG: hypothetical protein QM778_13460 [Myxococcales bacterium]